MFVSMEHAEHESVSACFIRRTQANVQFPFCCGIFQKCKLKNPMNGHYSRHEKSYTLIRPQSRDRGRERVLVESCEPNWKIEFFFSWFCKTRTQNTMKKALRRKNEVELMSAQTMNQLNLIRCLRA